MVCSSAGRRCDALSRLDRDRRDILPRHAVWAHGPPPVTYFVIVRTELCARLLQESSVVEVAGGPRGQRRTREQRQCSRAHRRWSASRAAFTTSLPNTASLLFKSPDREQTTGTSVTTSFRRGSPLE